MAKNGNLTSEPQASAFIISAESDLCIHTMIKFSHGLTKKSSRASTKSTNQAVYEQIREQIHSNRNIV
jgi:hypothetical protein